MVKINNSPEFDLLGNDLYLIVETHEELINSILGLYSRLISNEEKKEVSDLNKLESFSESIISLRKLKLELALKKNDIEFKKRTIVLLKNQLNDLKILDKSL